MACEHKSTTLLSGEEVVNEAIRDVHLRIHNILVRKLKAIKKIKEDWVHHENSK